MKIGVQRVSVTVPESHGVRAVTHSYASPSTEDKLGLEHSSCFVHSALCPGKQLHLKRFFFSFLQKHLVDPYVMSVSDKKWCVFFRNL